MPTAIRISGRAGRFGNFVNDTYEPMQITHHDKPCWVARSVAPRYLFHTGKSRWVVSKQIDDGARCWAYIEGPASTTDPSACSGPWTCCDQDGEWRKDPAVQCAAVPADADQFVHLRLTLDADMRQYGLVDMKDLKETWKRLDYNGNGIVSLAEIDKMVTELVAGGTWPAWLNNKPALMRAYKKTILKDGDGDDWVEKHEFHALLLNIFWFNKLWQIFSVIDTGDDRRIDFREFKAGLGQLGLNLSDAEARQEFAKVDTNNGGQVLFVEFCAYVRNRVNPDAQPEFDGDIMSGEKCGKTITKHLGHRALHDYSVEKKDMREFDELETKIKQAIADHKKLRALWERIDYNGNNIVSLAEIDKLIVESYPLLNHKPALMRAYKRTIRDGNGDDWVQRKEFKALLANLFYFNKLYWIFDETNGDDRRMTFKEFKKALVVCGCNMSEDQARREFSKVDRNGGGMILFDEFCLYFTEKMCPQALQDFVD